MNCNLAIADVGVAAGSPSGRPWEWTAIGTAATVAARFPNIGNQVKEFLNG